jgi:membrane protease YdiL (CAAX protease family)
MRLLGVSVPLVLVYRLAPVRDLARFCWQDLMVAVWLIAALLGHQLTGIWKTPTNLDFMGRLFLIAVAGWSWVFLRPVPGLGYDFRLSSRIMGAAGWNFALFAVIAIPTSLALRFTAWNPLHKGVLDFGTTFLEIFLFIALLEELFFRGFLQTLISENVRSPRVGQLMISCVFGLFHILHAPFPNWRYVLLATVAGWFYGSAFVRSGNLTASTLTHAMVDTVWRNFFSKS